MVALRVAFGALKVLPNHRRTTRSADQSSSQEFVVIITTSWWHFTAQLHCDLPFIPPLSELPLTSAFVYLTGKKGDKIPTIQVAERAKLTVLVKIDLSETF